MITKIQYENSNRHFIDFGAILYILAWFYVFEQIFYLFQGNIYNFNSILYLTIYFSFSIIFSILIYLLMKTAKNIEKYIPDNKNIKIFNIGLEIWFGIFVISVVIAIIQLSQTSLQSYLVWSIFGSILLIFGEIFEFITWISLNSFITNSRDYFAPDIKKNGHIATKILIISVVLEIFYLGIDMFATYDAQSLQSLGLYNVIAWILLIINYSTIILFVIGYFVLSVSLKRIKQAGFKINEMMRHKIEIPKSRDTSDLEKSNPALEDSTTDKPNIEDSTTDKPNIEDSTTDKPNIEDSTTDKPNIEDSTVDYSSIEAQSPKFCRYCGKTIENQPIMKFCRYCGKPID